MEPWEFRTYIEDTLEKQGLYALYHDLCLRVETIPITKEAFIDAYVDVLNRRAELYAQAVGCHVSDKTLLLEALEKVKAPVEDLVSVAMLPPSVTVTLNPLRDGFICLYVLFPNGPDAPSVIPAYIVKGQNEATFL
jgi:hypothetical protein